MSEDGSRILLGDAEGLLHLLTLSIRNNTVNGLCFIGLGNVSFFFIDFILSPSFCIPLTEPYNSDFNTFLFILFG